MNALHIVFSTLFNEGTEYLGAYLRNFLALNEKTGVILVNLPADVYEQVINKPEFYVDDLMVGSRVFYVKAERPRQLWGATLLLAHLDNYKVATSLFKFEYFCNLASNSLFFRAPDMVEILHQIDEPLYDKLSWHTDLSCYIQQPPVTETPFSPGDRRVLFKSFRDFIIQTGMVNVYGSDIEGLFTRRANWDLMVKYFDDLLVLEAAYADNNDQSRMALEEIFPATVIMEMGDRKFVSIGERLLDRRPLGGKVNFNDLLLDNVLYPAHVCVLKWFDRSTIAPVTLAVTDVKMRSDFAAVKAVFQNANPADLFCNYQLLLAAADVVKKRLGDGCNLFSRLADPMEHDWLVPIKTEVDRKQLHVTMHNGLPSYLFFEYLPSLTVSFELSITKAKSNVACLHWIGHESRDDSKINGAKLIAFWYLPLECFFASQPFYVSLTVTQADIYYGSQDFRGLYNQLVINIFESYFILKLDNCIGNELFYHFDPSEHSNLTIPNEGNVFLGVPIAFGQSVTLLLNVFPINR